MTTGNQLYTEFREAVGKSWSAYFPGAEWSAMWTAQLYELIRRFYGSTTSQHERDLIRDFIVLDHQTPVSARNYIHTQPRRISGISYAPLTSTVTITCDLPHDLAIGDQATINGVIGVTPINGTYPVAAVVDQFNFTFTVAGLVGTWTPDTGTVSTPYLIPNYKHLLSIRPRFETPIYDADIVDVEYGTTTIVWTATVNQVQSGDHLNITGTIGQPSGQFYAKRVSPHRIALYTDQQLSVPFSTASGAWEGGGSIRIIHQNPATETTPDQRISRSQDASTSDPRFMNGREGILLMPATETCQTAFIDYTIEIRNLPDYNDQVIDLERWYDPEMLRRVNAEATSEALRRMRANNEVSIMKGDIASEPIMNP